MRELALYRRCCVQGGEISGTPANCVELCSKVGSEYFGVLYDPCNLMAEGTDYREALSAFGEHVVHVHLKDGLRVDGKWERCGARSGAFSSVMPI